MNDKLFENMFSLEGKVSIVTGASRGIGFGVAQVLHRAGSIVYGLGRTDPSAVAADWNYVSCDVTDQFDVRRAIEYIDSQGNVPSVLVNAAGITSSDIKTDSLSNFKHIIETNLIAAYICCLEVLPFMRVSNSGSIINITSIGSKLGFPNNPGYVASKGGLRMLTKALAHDLIKDNIRVNNLAPGYIKTEMTRQSYEDVNLYNDRLNRMIIERWGKVDDLFGAIIFLASEASSYVTGLDLFVDGGWTSKGL